MRDQDIISFDITPGVGHQEASCRKSTLTVNVRKFFDKHLAQSVRGETEIVIFFGPYEFANVCFKEGIHQ